MREYKRSSGFTLAELLIVVAIIGVLVAISIPIFTSQLEKSREATDAANIRSHYAEVMAEAISSGQNVDGKTLYGAVPLKQTTDGWSSDSVKNNLESVYGGHIEGTGPTAGGTAWVEFNAADGYPILHYEGSGGGGSGGTGGDGNPGGNPAGGGSNPTNQEEVKAFLKEHADTSYPTQDAANAGTVNITLSAGKVYQANGKYYISTSNSPYTFDQYYYRSMDQLCNEYAMCLLDENTTFLSTKDKIIDQNNPINGTPAHYEFDRGDIFITEGGEYYIANNHSWSEQEPPCDPWIKITWQ